ncbi:uncharacterized protein nacad [Aplochiton taeniatus]
MPGESAHRSVPSSRQAERGAEGTALHGADMTRNPSTDSTPSDSGSTPSDSGSSPSPSTPQKLLPECTSPFGPRLVRATPSSSVSPRPQPEGSDHRHGTMPRLTAKFGGHGPCGNRGPVKMERIKVLTGSEIESDCKEPETMDTRVVMGQEALLKTKEVQKGKPMFAISSKAIPLPGIPGWDVPKTSVEAPGQTGDQCRLDTGQRGDPDQSQKMEQDQTERVSVQTHLSPLLTPLTPASSPSPEPAVDARLTDSPLSQDEVPSLSCELAYPIALSFSEPAYSVDPLRVGVPLSLDPDLYYTAPSTPIKMAGRQTHLKHRSYPGSPACPLSPASPSDSEELCSPLTSPSGSYVTAEGGSWTSSYTSSTSPSASPNMLLTEETQEAPACFVASLSEIGDEVAEERSRAAEELQLEVERDRGFCLYRSEGFGMSSRMGLTEATIIEEEEGLRGDGIRVSRGSCRPRWVTEDTSPLRSSSGRSSDSQEDGDESEGSLCPAEKTGAGAAGYPSPMPQMGLELELKSCMSEELYAQMDLPSFSDRVNKTELTSTALTPDTDNLTQASASLSLDSPDLPLGAYSPVGLDGDGPGSFLLFTGAYSYDGPEEEEEEEMMIPASLLNFPPHADLVFEADSMEITLFPTEDENEGGEDHEGNDVDAYAAGEEEADVEDDDDEEEVEVDREPKVVVKVKKQHARKKEGEEDEDESAAEEPTEEDTSASFLHSLSETSINEGLDEDFCFHDDDTDDSLDSSYNGVEDERLYSTERHAETLEPKPLDPPQCAEPRAVSECLLPANPPDESSRSPPGIPDPKESPEPPGSTEPASAHVESPNGLSGSESEMEISSGSSEPPNLLSDAPAVATGPSAPDQAPSKSCDGQAMLTEPRLIATALEEEEDSPTQAATATERPHQSHESPEEDPLDSPDRDSFKLLIKPRPSKEDKRKSAGAGESAWPTPKTPVFGPAVATGGASPSCHWECELELDQKNGNPTACASSLNLEETTATNDLNKGVPLLAYPKDPSPNPSNIPVSSCLESLTDPLDNLALASDLCPCDPAQENLRENMLSTEEGAPGGLGALNSPMAISPKRENSETDTGSKAGHGSGAWGTGGRGLELGGALRCGENIGAWGIGESLSLSLGQRYELEAESLLMCDMEGQSRQTAVVPNISAGDVEEEEEEEDDDVLGDEEDNNSLCGRGDKMADVELAGEGVLESNLSLWRSIEEISEAGGGEDGSSRFPQDDVSNLHPDHDVDGGGTLEQEKWKRPGDNVDSASPSPALNALSEDVRPRSGGVSVRESDSNIPLVEVPPQADAVADRTDGGAAGGKAAGKGSSKARRGRKPSRQAVSSDTPRRSSAEDESPSLSADAVSPSPHAPSPPNLNVTCPVQQEAVQEVLDNRPLVVREPERKDINDNNVRKQEENLPAPIQESQPAFCSAQHPKAELSLSLPHSPPPAAQSGPDPQLPLKSSLQEATPTLPTPARIQSQPLPEPNIHSQPQSQARLGQARPPDPHSHRATSLVDEEANGEENSPSSEHDHRAPARELAKNRVSLTTRDTGPANQREVWPLSSSLPTDRQSRCPISHGHKISEEIDLSFKHNLGSYNESESEGSVPELEEPEALPLRPSEPQSVTQTDEGLNRPKQSRSEKKARKAMSKLGLKPVHGVTRITIRKSKSILFVISRPDVFKSPASDIYIVFGEAKIEDLSQQVHKAAAEKFKVPASSSPLAPPAPPSLTIKEESEEEEEEEEEVEDGALEQRDIELVMAQANVSRAKAVRALKQNKNDIVNAIMELTM